MHVMMVTWNTCTFCTAGSLTMSMFFCTLLLLSCFQLDSYLLDGPVTEVHEIRSKIKHLKTKTKQKI